MNKLEELEELENKYKELGKEIEKLRNEIKKLRNEKKAGKWMPENGEKYWFIDCCGNVTVDDWANYVEDNYRRDFIKIFKTEEEAEDYLDFIEAKKECSYEFSQEEWEDDNIKKYSYYYDYVDRKLYKTFVVVSRNEGQTTFKTEEDRDNFIKTHEKQILKYDFGIC